MRCGCACGFNVAITQARKKNELASINNITFLTAETQHNQAFRR